MNSIFKSLHDISNLTLKSLGLINVDSNSLSGFQPSSHKFPGSESNKLLELLEILKENKTEEIYRYIRSYGCAILYEVFPQTSDTLIHWTCLSGNLEIMIFLKAMHEDSKDERKAEWSTLINSKNSLQQTPLHWACTIENISLIQFLIKNGADINAVDNKGVTPLIMSCQYGIVSGATFLILNGANIFLTDIEGDNALHWALYKGHAELGRLLIFYGLSCDQKDVYGQTPLHFASLSGNINCVSDLVEKENAEINVYDNNNKTPIMLAAGRKHKTIVEYLKFHIQARIKKLSILNKWKYKIFGTPNKNRLPMIFFLACAWLWGNPYYFYVIRPCSINQAQFINDLFIFCQCIMWFCFLMASLKNPGYVSPNKQDYNAILNEIKLLEIFKNTKLRDYKNPINKICHSCKGVKPIRSKHCKICDRCVQEMDHHCPYVGNCIGKRNRPWFLCFLILMNVVNILVAYLLYISYLESAILIHTAILTTVLILFGLLLGFTLNLFMCKQAITNLTLIEAQRWKKYNYLQNETGSFLNQFDRGWITNLLIFFNIKTLI